MKLQTSSAETTAIFSQFTQGLKEAAEQRAQAQRWQDKYNEENKAKATALREKQDIQYTLDRQKEDYKYVADENKRLSEASNKRSAEINEKTRELRIANDTNARIQKELDTLNQKLVTLEKNLQGAATLLPVSGPPTNEQATNLLVPVLTALHRKEFINAIKLVREATGFGLKEAKDLVEGNLESVQAPKKRATAC